MKLISIWIALMLILAACTPAPQPTEEAESMPQTEVIESVPQTQEDEPVPPAEEEASPDLSADVAEDSTTTAFVPFSDKDLVFYTMDGKAYASLQKNTQIISVTEQSTYLKYPSHETITSTEETLLTARDVGIVTSYVGFLDAYGAKENAVWEFYDKEGNRKLLSFADHLPENAQDAESLYLYIGFSKADNAWAPIPDEELKQVLDNKTTLSEDTEIVTFCVSLDDAGIIQFLYVLYTTVGELVF